MTSNPELGIRNNLPQFSLLVLINAFVGAMVGMERSILPAIAEEEFLLAARTAILSFIVVFGISKALTNYFAGRWSDAYGRRIVLIAGWIVALPVPFILMWAPTWSWIIFANVLLGISQGLTWSTTVIMKIDLAGPKNRGFAMGVNEFAGYFAVAGSALATGYIASRWGLRPEPFYIGVVFVVLGLLLSITLVKETKGHAAHEATLGDSADEAELPSQREIFWRTSLKDKNLSSISQAGLVNNLNDGMAWGLFPLVFAAAGMSLVQIGWLAAIYPAVWGLGQLYTGALSDRIGRKGLIVAGMWLQSAGIVVLILSHSFFAFASGAVLLGAGTAMVYPTLLAAIGDVVHPGWRASAVGVYRLWRDLGYAVGAVLAGIVADLAGLDMSMWVIAGLTFASGTLVLFRLQETRAAQTMNISRLAIHNPVAVTAAILMVLLMGGVGLSNLPIQMIPDAQRPFINVTTGWRSAAPQEVESAIIEPQEDMLRGIPGLLKMTSSASRGNGSINLSFTVETDLQRALIEVMNRLNQVPRYPPDVSEPRIFAGQDRYGSAIAWFAITPVPGNDREIASYNDFIKEVVLSRVERVPGVSNASMFGGRQEEVRITFDPFAAAALNIDIPTMAGLTGGNEDTSGGYNDVGRRQYSLRYAGKYDLDEFGDMVLDWRGGNPVRLRDVATIEIKLRDASGGLLAEGIPAIAFNAQVEKGVNVLNVMRDLKLAVAELEAGPLQRAGLLVRQSYDESTYITNSIAMLRTNLLLGIALAIGVLWWFLRRFRATLMVALAIPICLFTAFFVLQISGRSLNMISLAGLAFAMGMVLDGAIVVLENTIRLREHGMEPQEAAEKGASQVWGALLASTATTVAIFMPILFLKDLSARLFADLALAISVAVVASLIIAVTVIPTATANWLRRGRATDLHADWWRKITASIMKLTDGVWRRRSLVGGLFVTATALTVMLLPPADYLPKGKDTWIFAFILMPPGQSVISAKEDFQEVLKERLDPYLEDGAENQIDAYFFGTFGATGFLGIMVKDPDDADNFIDLLNDKLLAGFPDTMAFADRAGIFERLGDGGGIQLNIQSRDMDSMLVAAKAGLAAIGESLPGAQARPEPGVELAAPELRLIPNERRITEAGWTRQQMATVVRALGDGVYVGDYFDGDLRRDIVLRATNWTSPEQLAATPLATPDGGIQPVSQLVRMIRTAGPNEIRRVDRRRTITLNVTPPRGMSLEETVAILRQEVEPVILDNLSTDGEVSYFGSANDLKIALSNMSNSFTLAILILYLLVSALFRSFKDGALVLLALPLATVGGVMMLRIVNVPMDLLTMVGFITLLGLVVNNAILLVHQTRTAEREGIGRKDAVEQAIRRRLRPILMSTLTSLFGMLPLLLIPGPGSEVYKGLAAVIVGGMAVSTVFTLVFLPSLLRMGERSELSRAVSNEPAAEPVSG